MSKAVEEAVVEVEIDAMELLTALVDEHKASYAASNPACKRAFAAALLSSCPSLLPGCRSRLDAVSKLAPRAHAQEEEAACGVKVLES